MPVYAPTPGFADQRRHPQAMLLIIGVHAVLIGAVMTARMAVPVIDDHGPIIVDWIKSPPPPPPPEPTPETPRPRNPTTSSVDRAEPIIPAPRPTDQTFDQTPAPDPGTIAGSDVDPDPPVFTSTLPTPVRVAARFATPDWLVRPPYPADKQRLEEEAVLRLRLLIDERGRVTGVEPIGHADRSFLDAARKHLMAKWRYKPATEDGRAVPSSTVITLRFELA